MTNRRQHSEFDGGRDQQGRDFQGRASASRYSRSNYQHSYSQRPAGGSGAGRDAASTHMRQSAHAQGQGQVRGQGQARGYAQRQGHQAYSNQHNQAHSSHVYQQLQHDPRMQYDSHAHPSGANMYSRSAYGAASAMAKPQKSNNPKAILIMLIVIVVLAAIIGIRWFVNAGTSSELHETNTAISQQQSRLDELNQSNSDLQSKIDSMQSTIDAYNKLKK